MGLDKRSTAADEAANLYRAALFLGLGQIEAGRLMLKKTSFPVPDPFPQKTRAVLVLAEKILDEYHRRVRLI